MSIEEIKTITTRRGILEMGAGNDLHGGDYTKAALRAVQDAIHHSSLTMIRTLGIDRSAVQINVTIGVQNPEDVDTEVVKESLPIGTVFVSAVTGGLDILDSDTGDKAIVASAAIEVRLPLP